MKISGHFHITNICTRKRIYICTQVQANQSILQRCCFDGLLSYVWRSAFITNNNNVIHTDFALFSCHKKKEFLIMCVKSRNSEKKLFSK